MLAFLLLTLSVASTSELVIPRNDVDVHVVEYLADMYTVVTVHFGGDTDIRLYGGKTGGSNFAEAHAAIITAGRKPIALMNGGMSDSDHRAVGLLVTNGEIHHQLIVINGAGSFYLKPNGAFWLDTAGRAHVTTTDNFLMDRYLGSMLRRPNPVVWATQSGPMLHVGDYLHPEFKPESTNWLIRNAVGTSDGGYTVRLVISHEPVRFYDLATLFRDQLGCDNAMLLDEGVSRLWTTGTDLPAGHYASVIAVTRALEP
ncbi:MAG: hypothetical protein JW384_03612 [Nitrosomonadaceae bacterium]|nr:hypothetical protein [Nitrosomonadaceae bacterium]